MGQIRLNSWLHPHTKLIFVSWPTARSREIYYPDNYILH